MTDALNGDGMYTEDVGSDRESDGEVAALLGADFDAFCAETMVGALTFARFWARQDRELADDALQEAFLRLMKRWSQRRNEPFVANRNYLLTIVVREISRLRQRGARRESLLHDGSATQGAAKGDVAAAVAGDLMFREFLKTLPDEQRAVAVLHYEFAMTAAEIAEVVQTNPSTVRTRLQRLRAKAVSYVRSEGQESPR